MDDVEKVPTMDVPPHRAWELVRSAKVGRLAVISGSGPEIFPINHVVDHNTIVFRTAAGTKLALSRNRPVAFECDGYDEAAQQAWSVVIKGVAGEVVELYEAVEFLGLGTVAWQGGSKPYLMRIEADSITGRCFDVPATTVHSP